MNYKLLFLGAGIVLSVAAHKAYSQYERVWVFGGNNGLNFANGRVDTFSSGINFGFGEAAASVCDANGQLLFSTEGSLVWDRDFALMPNGKNLTGLSLYDTVSMTASASQGTAIASVPYSPNKYYVFSLVQNEEAGNAGKLYYSVVNMELNGGKGDIEPDKKGIFIGQGFTEHMAVVAGDRCNMWVVLAVRTNTGQQQFRGFEITENGVDTVSVNSNTGIAAGTVSSMFIGAICFSPDRKKMAIGRMAVGGGSLELYDFDAATGVISSPKVLTPQRLAHYGVCFSEDNTKLYANNVTVGIDQFDISINDSSAIVQSRKLIDTGLHFTQIKRAENGALYYAGALDALSRISFPNLSGIACGPVQGAIRLPGSIYGGLPAAVAIFNTAKDTGISKDIAVPCFVRAYGLRADNDDGWDYVWSNGHNGKEIEVGEDGVYYVSYMRPPCNVHTDTFHVVFSKPLPSVAVVAPCKGIGDGWVVARALSDEVVTYVWGDGAGTVLRGPVSSSKGDSLGGLGAGRYVLQMTTQNGCDTMLFVNVPQGAYEGAYIADSLVCLGDTVSFRATGIGDFVGWLWDFGDGNGAVVERPEHVYEYGGVYPTRLVSTTSHGCRDTVYGTVMVDTVVNSFFEVSRDRVCAGMDVLFSYVGDSSVTGLYWSFGEGEVLMGESTLGAGGVRHAYDSSGVMAVTLKLRFRACPDDSFSRTITVGAMPVVTLGNDTSLCANSREVTLFNGHADAEGVHYSWSTGDTGVSIVVKHPGVYSVSVYDDNGCSGSDSITVYKSCYLDIPNAFTPNGDGVNDYFFPRRLLSERLRVFRMRVWSRWGEVVFETSQVDGRGWDGKYNDKEQTAGAYVYLIEAGINGEDVELYQGNVTLLR